MMDAIASVLTGGITGLIGTAVSGVVEYFKTKQRNAHELAMIQAERETLQLEIAGRERVAEIESESARDISASESFRESLRADIARYSSGDSPWLVGVDVVRGLVRPVLTLGLVAFTAWIYATAPESMEDQVTSTVLYVCTAAVLWWFGTRVKMPTK